MVVPIQTSDCGRVKVPPDTDTDFMTLIAPDPVHGIPSSHLLFSSAEFTSLGSDRSERTITE